MCWKCDRIHYLHTAKLMDSNFKLTGVFYRREVVKLFPDQKIVCSRWKEKEKS